MSADNYIVVREEGKKWVGYMQFASDDKEHYITPLFVAKSVREAIMRCQSETVLEYGYRIDFERKERDEDN